MANVDPFVIQWPRKWLEDPEINPVVTYLNRFLHDLFIRSGGGDDTVETIDFEIPTNAAVQSLERRLNEINTAAIESHARDKRVSQELDSIKNELSIMNSELARIKTDLKNLEIEQ